MHPVYEPREDSYLLQEQVKEYARGRVLDMGTGTGILAVAAAENGKVEEVVAVDVNPDAISYARKHNTHRKVYYKESDMFSNVEGDFDTIIFNPPYLPDDEELADIALDGGPTGLELATEFIMQAKDRLREGGIILMVLSSHTDLNFFQGFCKKAGFKARPLAHKKIDFETLYVYILENEK